MIKKIVWTLFVFTVSLPSLSAGCESALSDEILVSFDYAALTRAKFQRVGNSRFWFRDSFVVEDLGGARGRIWHGYFTEMGSVPFSPRVALVVSAKEGLDLIAWAARLTSGTYAGRYACCFEKPGSTSHSIRKESEMNFDLIMEGRAALADQFRRAGFAREGESDVVWTRTLAKYRRSVRVIGLINDRDEAFLATPAALRSNQDVIGEDLRLGLAADDPFHDLTLGNEKFRFRLRDNGYLVDVDWTADLSRVPIDDPVFGRPTAGTKFVDGRVAQQIRQDEALDVRKLAEPFAKLALLHARQLLGDRVRFGADDVRVIRADMRSIHHSQFDDFEVNTGAMILEHPRRGTRIIVSYLAAYEAFAYGYLGREGSEDRLDPQALADFWR